MVESTPFNFNIINIQHQQLDLNMNIKLNYPEVSRPISILNHRTYNLVRPTNQKPTSFQDEVTANI